MPLDAHPQLLAWLNTHEPDDPDQIMQLKMHLLHVNTAKGLGPEQLKAQQTLDRVLLQRSRTASSETAPETSTKKPPNRLNMGDYAQVSSLFAHKAKQVKAADEENVTHSL